MNKYQTQLLKIELSDYELALIAFALGVYAGTMTERGAKDEDGLKRAREVMALNEKFTAARASRD